MALLLLLTAGVLFVGLLVGGPDLVSDSAIVEQSDGLTANLIRIPVLILEGTAVLSILPAVLIGVVGQ